MGIEDSMAARLSGAEAPAKPRPVDVRNPFSDPMSGERPARP
jgi:hypothetical protein